MLLKLSDLLLLSLKGLDGGEFFHNFSTFEYSASTSGEAAEDEGASFSVKSSVYSVLEVLLVANSMLLDQ